MSQPQYGVVAIGNALVDILSQTSEEFISQNGVEKGTMALIEEDQAEALYNTMQNCVESGGGSAANTMAGFASFGGKGGFIGKVADDDLGQIFQHDLRSLGLECNTTPLSLGPKTGRCLVLITPDGERTMNTFLGASVEIKDCDVDTYLITNAQITYLEGYLFDRKNAKHAFIKAAESAHKAGHRVALSLSDPFCVDRHREDFLKLVKSHIDILFANEDEIKSLYQVDSFKDALAAVSDHVEITALTRGAQGAVIRGRGETLTIPAVPVAQVVDTTGAGDQFAAGVLYGLTEGKTLAEAGHLGALAAAEVISHIGPRPATNLKELATQNQLT